MSYYIISSTTKQFLVAFPASMVASENIGRISLVLCSLLKKEGSSGSQLRQISVGA